MRVEFFTTPKVQISTLSQDITIAVLFYEFIPREPRNVEDEVKGEQFICYSRNSENMQ